MIQVVSASYQSLIEQLKRLTQAIEQGLNVVFSQKYNPLYYHGALPNFFLWVLFISGLLLFAYYSPTLEKAYPSMEYITKQIPSGALIRALHRYAADGMMVFVLIHFFRVWFTDRYREYRILPWITGVILFIVLFLAGLTGYMLIWDADSVALTNMTVHLLTALPWVGPALAETLLGGKIITDFTLTRYLFLHLAIPSSMLFFLWWHYLRITRPVTNAPLVLNILMLGGLLLWCGLNPVGLGTPPSLAAIPTEIDINWLYMLPHGVLASGWSLTATWLITLGIPVAMLALPYIQKKQARSERDYAQVVSDNCTGCSLCYHDCPYEAITMVDRDDDTRFKRLAVVDQGRCANCGLCVGACAFKAIEIPRMDTTLVLDKIQLSLGGS